MTTATLEPSNIGSVTHEIEYVGPEKAAQWLLQNKGNRPVRQAVVETLAGAMERGHFDFNAETIKFTISGRLADGQHRCEAIVLSGVTIPLLVVRGLPENVHETVDFTLKRTFADTLFFQGEENTNILAGAVRLAWSLETIGSPNPTSGTVAPRPSPDLFAEYLSNNPGIRESISTGVMASKSEVRYGRPEATALHYLMDRRDGVLAHDFWESVMTGIQQEEGAPAFVLRNALIRDIGARRHMTRTARLAITVKAWNAAREGREIKLLKWSGMDRSEGREGFPVIQ